MKRIPDNNHSKHSRYDKYIPSSVTNIPNQKDIEGEPYLISFEYYRDDLCQTKSLQSSAARRALQDLRKIGKCTIVTLRGSNIDTHPIERANDHYRIFFKHIPEEITLYHSHISQSGSMFYFVMKNLFYVIAFQQSHPEVGKNKR
jgi:hypothetical protein